MSQRERRRREDIIIREYGEYIRGICVYTMSDAQIFRISESILRKKREYERECDVPEEYHIVEEPRTPSPYYYNEYGQLCVINDSGVEEVVEC